MILKKGKELILEDFSNGSDIKFGSETHPTLTGIKINVDGQGQNNLLHEAQKEIIRQALNLTGNNVTRAAQMLGIARTSLNSCIQRFHIKTDE